MTIPFSGFKGTSLLDYPGKVSVVLFVAGCNLRCPYCHNGRLFQVNEERIIAEGTILRMIEERAHFIDAVVITGGEPSLYHELIDVIGEIKRRTQLLVKLDTNGLRPDFIRDTLPLTDFIAVDIKTTPLLYSEQLGASLPSDEVERLLSRTKELLEQTDRTVEYRTTVYPPVVDERTLVEMHRFVPTRARWVLQQFQPETAWHSDAQNTPALTDADVARLARRMEERFSRSVVVR